jgi:hypothetical protein
MIRYRTLFQVDITHDYFLSRGDVVFEAQSAADRTALEALYSVSNFLEIFPDPATLARMAGHKMIFRATDAGFLVALQLDPSASDLRPAVPPGPDFRLSFAIRVSDARFANYTELGPVTSRFYRFGNDSLNAVAGTRFLSRPVAAFDATRRYVAGEIRSQATGPTFDLFLALRDTGPAAVPVAADWKRIPADTWSATSNYQTGAIVLFSNQLYRAIVDGPASAPGNIAEWQPTGTLGNQYVSVTDAALPVAGLLNVDVSGAALAQATLRLFRADAAVVVAEQTFVAEAGVLGNVQVDLRGFTPGPYRFEVLDASLDVVPALGGSLYLAPVVRTEGWFGVIDIGRGAGDFALFNADGTLRAPVYTLRFLNRATRWRYIFPAAQAVGTGSEVAPEAGSDRILVTPAARPLTRFGLGSKLQADDPTTAAISEEILLPAPEVNRIRRQNAEWFSETHLPNLTVGP